MDLFKIIPYNDHSRANLCKIFSLQSYSNLYLSWYIPLMHFYHNPIHRKLAFSKRYTLLFTEVTHAVLLRKGQTIMHKSVLVPKTNTQVGRWRIARGVRQLSLRSLAKWTCNFGRRGASSQMGLQ